MACGVPLAQSAAAVGGALLLGVVIGGLVVGLARAARAYRGLDRIGGGGG